ncbi:PaaX family transcriptional regulator [Frankia sp. CNm7]|uniref:PaaX family transcriptional regulator n=1 Tax=Frankia nepalensis TaxID=1836974 RepID=A0A937UNY9_9ACTN|nr:PaaX family transcriptional regulator C-terminal domain-containing protein [Frankia nepalensis]MBL7502214.1 PaaX family transcriptional regulator [Frankia nepalensis]MBL7513054.1 PaaX family transcriptional regulator [Frankia nepalensis]MBL7519616.1 PaaX family transcriptional regulator [Frankia nepalensis]MBL7630329.1 PaaX family transcriptional regulator [Frankia nepalensis]
MTSPRRTTGSDQLPAHPSMGRPVLRAVPGNPEVDLPRSQEGQQPQRLLTVLLGDFWHGRREHLPSAALVALLADFDVTTVGARAALSRLSRRGVLESSRVGRNTYYGLTAQAAVVVLENVHRLRAFGARHDPWDGRWTVAAFSLPEDQRDVRHSVRSRLRWLGFAPLYDGMWVSPRPVAEPARRVFAELGVLASTVLTTTVDARRSDPRPPMAAWDLTELRADYEEFIATNAGLRDRALAGEISGAEAMVARVGLLNAWWRFPSSDPDLPLELLPERWPRRGARELFAETYGSLGPPAAEHFRARLAQTAPDLAPLASYQRADGSSGTTAGPAPR